MAYVIRKGRKEDSKAITRIVTQEWNSTYKGMVPDYYLEELKEKEEERTQKLYDKFDIYYNHLVLEENNKVVGFSRYGRTNDLELDYCGELYALYVLDEYHGKGYGKELVEKTKEELKKMGYDKMIIACLKENPSNEFYKHIGGKYIKDGVYLKFNLKENIYYYEIK